MPNRWGLGPVFLYESLIAARRWQVYAGRAGFVLTLLVGLMFVWFSRSRMTALTPTQQLAEMGEGFFYALTSLQISLILLAAPAVAAGAVCVDRARGTLVHMMVTDLSDSEIILGKLGSRLVPVFGLVACGLPVAALAGLLGGVDFMALVCSFAITLAVAVLGCSLALALSVRVKKLHEVMMAVYLAEGFGLLALPLTDILAVQLGWVTPPVWFAHLNPYVLAFAPYYSPATFLVSRVVIFVVASLALATVLLVWSIQSLRREVREGAGKPIRVRRRWTRLDRAFPSLLGPRNDRRRWWAGLVRTFPSLAGPSLDGNPVLWREWHRNRPSRLSRFLWITLFALTWGLVGWGVGSMLLGGDIIGSPLAVGTMLQVTFGLLMVAAIAPTALAEERMRGSLDILLSTPMTTRSIVGAKWWGAFRKILVLAILPLFAAVFMAATVPDMPAWARTARPSFVAIPLTPLDRIVAVGCASGDFLASGAAIVSLGLLLATWIPRLGRAVAASVIAYFLIGLGWPILIGIFINMFTRGVNMNDYRWVIDGLMSVSPIVGSINAIDSMYNAVFTPRKPTWIAFGLVILTKLAFAVGVYQLTVRTFDRCLGRVAEVKPVADFNETTPNADEPVEELAAASS